jgi:hypothetical protein
MPVRYCLTCNKWKKCTTDCLQKRHKIDWNRKFEKGIDKVENQFTYEKEKERW